jgi:hypothetical protein
MHISKSVRWFAQGSLMLLAIYLGSKYLIQSALAPPSISQKNEVIDPALQAANNTRFRSLFDAGNQALRDGKYSSALDSFLEAERSADQLTDEQYESLKKSRVQIAETYENSGDSSAAASVYVALEHFADRDGQALFQAKEYERALVRAQDAEQFSDRLFEGRQSALQESRTLLVNCLNALQRYPEAAEAQQRMIDYLKATSDDDKALADNYLGLANIHFQVKDWRGAEQSLGLAIDASDRTLSRYSADDNQLLIGATRMNRNWAQYNLVIAEYQEGETGTALAKAEDFFAEYSKPRDKMHPLNVAYHADDFAALALQIARETQRQNDIEFWQRRAPGGIRIIALHPAQVP